MRNSADTGPIMPLIDTTQHQQEIDMTAPTDSLRYTETYSVVGMTCGHCVASVTEELTEVPGVGEVNVDLVAGGTSEVTVTSARPLTEAAVRTAVEEAGYQLA